MAPAMFFGKLEAALAASVACLMSLSTARAVAAEAETCSEGKTSRLAIVTVSRPEILRHDENIGKDALVLTTKDRKELLRESVDDAHLRCLGFSEAAGHHLLGIEGERGTWMVLGSILYVAETGGPLVPSAFDRGDLMALASLTSPKGRYVAFVGGHQDVDGLFILDTQTDQVRRLGTPPAPPPVRGRSCNEPFGWGSCWSDAHVTLEPKILRFEGEDVLVVSYGKDTSRHRAKQRTVRRLRLSAASVQRLRTATRRTR
jgi:hypothetical protein